MPCKSSGSVLRAAFPYTVPVLTGFVFLGIAYGVLMNAKGYGPLWSTLMSAIAFGGSMQFVAISLLTTVFDPMQAFLLSCMVNARHLFYGLSMLEKYRGLGKARIPLIYVLCDETFSLVSTVDPPRAWTERDSISLSPCWTTLTGWAARLWAAFWAILFPLTPQGWTLP
jgi:4-azaleucine resistance transporter AzlC